MLYKIYQILILLPVTVIDSAVMGILTSVFCSFAGKRWGYYWANLWGSLWAKIIVRTTLLPVTVTGRENIDPKKGYVIVANHQGCYDIFLIFGYLKRPIRWMMKSSLRKVPFIGKACANSGQIFVDNSSPAKVKATYEQARRVLRDGASVMVFPEGARTYTGKMRAFKRGAFLLADELQIPVVPVTINGPFRVMPRQRDFRFAHWHPLSLTIHEPIMPIGQGATNVEHLMKESRKAINSALEEEFKSPPAP